MTDEPVRVVDGRKIRWLLEVLQRRGGGSSGGGGGGGGGGVAQQGKEERGWRKEQFPHPAIEDASNAKKKHKSRIPLFSVVVVE